MNSTVFLSALSKLLLACLLLANCSKAVAQPVQDPYSTTTVPATDTSGGPEKPHIEVPGNQPQPPAAAAEKSELLGDQPAAEVKTAREDGLIERGRYLVVIAGCNDCHTAGFSASAGSVPEKDWLLGDSIGYRGPWGTTFPVNLRLYMKGMTEERWLAVARNLKSRPPMASYALNQMDEDDLKAIYRFVRSLGETGKPAPKYLAPGTDPSGRYINFEPVEPNAAAKIR